MRFVCPTRAIERHADRTLVVSRFVVALVCIVMVAFGPMAHARRQPAREDPAADLGDGQDDDSEPAPADEPEEDAAYEPEADDQPAASVTKLVHERRSSKGSNTSEQKKRAPTRKDAACGYRTRLYRHEVVPGEHLGGIAGRYGVRRTDLVRQNRTLKNPDMIRPGQHIQVCPEIPPRERTKITYAILPGDNLGKIAKKYGLTVGEIERFQEGRLRSRDALRVGQELRLWVDGSTLEEFAPGDEDRGKLKGGLLLPQGKHYFLKTPSYAWGTAGTIKAILAAVSRYKQRSSGGPKVHFGDISRRGGGPLRGHRSHQTGRDIDVGYVLRGERADETKFVSAGKSNLDVSRTWALVKAFIDTNQIRYIFVDYGIQELLYEHARKRGSSEETLDELFQFPRGRGRHHGIIRHWKGHRNHFHVRFRR